MAVFRTVRLAERSIEALRPEPGKAKTQFTVEGYPGLKVVVSSAGSRRWEFRFTRCGRKEVLQWGGFPGVSISKVKSKYLEAQAKLADGRDPAEASRVRREDLTLAEFVEREFLPHQRSNIRSARIQEWMIAKFIHPLYGARRLKDISRHDVVKLGNTVRDATTPVNANRYLSVFARILNLAFEWGYVTVNVAERVKHFKTADRRERFLSADEIRRLDEVLAAEDTPGASCIRLALFLGMRRGEICSLRWEDIALDGGAPSLFLRRTKAGNSRTVPLNSRAVEVLRACERFRVTGSPYVFPSPVERGHIIDLRFTWKKAKKAAGLDSDLRLHDLRHTFASQLVQGGTSLYVVQKLLGHHNPSMTQRYSHLADAVLREASESAVARTVGGG